jgi:uncharacterized damage-inducible protein DinB
MANVDLSRVPPFYHNYIKLAYDKELKSALKDHQSDLLSVLKNISAKKWDYRYAEGKWSIKELVQHIIDAERIFSYRALCLARKDKTAFPSFDENNYADNSKADKRTKENLINELKIVQKSSSLLFDTFDQEQLESSGIVSGNPTYVKALGYIIVGHTLHHLNILKERYLRENVKI